MHAALLAHGSMFDSFSGCSATISLDISGVAHLDQFEENSEQSFAAYLKKMVSGASSANPMVNRNPFLRIM